MIGISSIATALSPANVAIYAATKGALEQLTRSLARELAPRGVTVNAVSPGTVDIEMTVEELREATLRTHPRGRLGQPDDIADAVALLASERAGWITGETIVAAGGGT